MLKVPLLPECHCIQTYAAGQLEHFATDGPEGILHIHARSTEVAKQHQTQHLSVCSMVQTEEASKAMNPHEAAKKEAEETSEERAKRIASQWIKDDSTSPTFSPAPTFDAPQVGNLPACFASTAQCLSSWGAIRGVFNDDAYAAALICMRVMKTAGSQGLVCPAGKGTRDAGSVCRI